MRARNDARKRGRESLPSSRSSVTMNGVSAHQPPPISGATPMSRTSFFSAALALFLTSAAHAEPVRFARTPDISPDGKTIAFSYLGDIWLVDAQGGPARHLTMHEKHDFNPIFSPDGKQIAFSSNRHGSYDVFVVPIA